MPIDDYQKISHFFKKQNAIKKYFEERKEAHLGLRSCDAKHCSGHVPESIVRNPCGQILAQP